jgi:hypothetical protein
MQNSHEVLHDTQTWTPMLAEPALENNQLESQIKKGQERLIRLGKLELTIEEQQVAQQGKQYVRPYGRRLGALHVAFDNTARTVYKFQDVAKRRHVQPPTH